jgi:hypothetical protein
MNVARKMTSSRCASSVGVRLAGFALTFVLLLCVAPAYAQSASDVRVLGLAQQDLDGDGQADLGVIQCACVTDHDLIQVFDGAGDMPRTDAWQKATDMANDTWVFDIGGDGNANLVIVFRQDGENQIAELYDDVNKDGYVSYHVEGKKVAIDESRYWTTQVTAQHGWWRADGRPNLNLQILTDTALPTDEKYAPPDGKPDNEAGFVDKDDDGVADYWFSRLLRQVPLTYDFSRSGVAANAGHVESVRPETAPFWPFLDFKPATSGTALRYFERVPSLVIDWQRSRISGFKMPGYPQESGYWLNNHRDLYPNQVNDVNFEAPQAYYDLAANRDRFPELHARLNVSPIGPWQDVRYSWNLFSPGTLRWDYKIGVMSDDNPDNPYEVVDFGAFSVRMISYERLPYWATEREWKLTTFVARESGVLQSSEGIYAWSPEGGEDVTSRDNPSSEAMLASHTYLTGTSVRPPYDFFTDIWQGYRGEYNLSRPLHPVLYFSPIDRRLHLKGAEHGLLNLGEGRYLLYDNRDKDDYLEQMRLSVGDEVEEQLYHAPSHLVYAGRDEVIVKGADVNPSQFETLPPRDHAEWAAQGAKVVSPDRNIAPDDFRAMLAQFDGPEMRITGASLHDYRPTASEGFRFVLDLQPGYRIAGGDLLGLAGTVPGQYAVSYNGDFVLEPLTPPALGLSFQLPGTSGTGAGGEMPIRVLATNTGTADAVGLTLVVSARAGESSTEVMTQTLDVLAGEPDVALVDWQPPAPADWQLDAQLRNKEGAAVAETSMSFASATGQRNTLIPTGIGLDKLVFGSAVLVLGALLAAGAFVFNWLKEEQRGW